MKRFKTRGRRLISAILCLALLMSFLPSFATAIDVDAIDNRVVDDVTWDEWKLLFGPDHPSTENAGAVWTDKSVFTPNNLPKEFTDANGKLTDTGDNFLVALSAIASNKEIVGYSTIPTDTILVLDVSGSMDSGNPSRASQMVTAANDAIKDLLALNYHNRIGVVLYSGSSSSGSSTYAQGTVLAMPLDRYTIDTSGDNSDLGFLYLDDGTVKVRNNVYNSQNRNNFDKSKSVVGGTYIQAGLYMAMTEFKGIEQEDTVIEDGIIQGGAKRMPITVLMSDGAPTLATTNYTNVSSGSSNVGNGVAKYCETDEVGFLTQLTAAYVKSEIEAWYETDSLFYTLGVGVGNSAVAKAVLDPANANDGSQNYWSSYLELGSNSSLRLTVPGTASGGSVGNPGTKQVTVYRNAVITRDNYIYTDKYFTAEGDGLQAGFEDIVNEIYIQSRYYPTSLEGGNPDFSGYIEFQDKIGEYMQVKDIKGILLNGVLYTGEMLTSKIGTELGTIENPSELGIAFRDAVMTRLGISEMTEAFSLIAKAWQDGQLSYNQRTGEFSNYIGWYAYADGSYAGYYNEGTTTPPAGAVYANKSYGMLGEATGSIKDSDMMFMSIQVHTTLETGEQSLIWKIPASLVPMVTYNVSVKGNVINDDTVVTEVVIEEATPVRLLYEVGLHPAINALNVSGIVDEKHIDENGNRVFWSNYFDIDAPGYVNDTLTYSDFTPNEDNERYYYVDIAPIYSSEGSDIAITSAPVAGRTYYTKQYIFSPNSNKPIVYYEAIAADDITAAEYNETLECYVIPGHVYNHPNVDAYFKYKEDISVTDSAETYYYPTVLETNSSYVVSTHHGNNGKLTVERYDLLAIPKSLDEIEVGASQDFKFKITLSAPAGTTLASEYDYVLASLNETVGTEGKVRVNSGVIEVELSANQTIYITDIPEGTLYTVEEVSDNDDYMVKSVHVNGVAQAAAIAAGVITKYTIDDVDFLNTPTSEGGLIIKKEVKHPFASDPSALSNKLFTVNVKLSGGDVANKTYTLSRATGDSTVTTNANGEFTVTLTANESVSIKGILAETNYVITEPAATMPAGFELDSSASTNLTGSIPADANITATVVNNYEYSSVTSDIDVLINKKLNGRVWLDDDSFEFEVLRYNTASRVAEDSLYKVNLTKNKQTDTYLLNETYDAEGIYYYIIRENAGDDNIGITYDTIIREFRVIVTDNDMDGRLEISAVENVLRTSVSGDAASGFVVTANDFNNNYAATGGTAVTIDVDKTIDGGEFQLNGFKFGLYFDVLDDNDQPTGQQELFMESTLTDVNGKASFNITYTAASVGKTFKYYLKEIDTGIPGMTYDDTVYLVSISIIDNLDGTISYDANFEDVTSPDNPRPVNSIAFNNTYTPKNGELLLSGRKELENRVQYAGEFKFELHETDSTYAISENTLLETVSNNFDGNFTFSLLTYSAEGTHYYVIKEINTGIAGVAYDTTVYEIEVNVEQDGSAYVSKVVSGTTDIVFTNTYTAKPVDVTLSGNKTLLGRDLNSGEFTFELYETNNRFSTNGLTAVQSKNNVANTFTFDKLTFEEEGIYYYVVKEKVGALGGVTYDTGEYRITIVVTDNGRGQLVQTTTITRDGQTATAMVFVNSYAPNHTYIDLEGVKVLDGRDMEEGEFEFRLINTLNENVVATTTNKADGSFKFEDIRITSAGTHHGRIVEVVTNKGGVTYDSKIYGFILVIEDDLNGNLVETNRRIWLDGQQVTEPIEFHNYYAPANEVISFGGTKTLEGRTLNEGEFEFNLYETDSTYSIDGVTPTETVKNGADGKFDFSDILIDTDGDRYFAIVEDATAQIENVKYDTTVYKIKVSVTDNGVGNYIIDTVVMSGDDVVEDVIFANVFTPKDVTFDIDIQKILENKSDREMGLDGFDFTLVGEDINLNTKTDAEGKAGFKLTFTANDIGKTFNYTVSEVEGGIKGMIYSEETVNIKLTVGVNADGVLEIYLDDSSTPVSKLIAPFTNVYEGDPDIPVTGDTTKPYLWFAFLLAGTVGLIGIIAYGKKTKETEE